MEGVFESIDHKTFTVKHLKAIAECLFQESRRLSGLERHLAFMIYFDDHSVRIKDRPDVFEDINKPIQSVWMNLNTETGSHRIEVRLNESAADRSDSYISINGPSLDWVYVVQGKLTDIIKGLDNRTQRIYKPPGWLNFLSLLFNLAVVILFSYSFFLLFDKVLGMPTVFSVVLFVVTVQLLLYVVPSVTTDRFRAFLVEVRPRIELVTHETRMEREKKSTRWAVLKTFVLPAVLSLLAAFLSSRLFQ